MQMRGKNSFFLMRTDTNQRLNAAYSWSHGENYPTIPGTCVQYPGFQGGGALGDASKPGTPADSIAASAHKGTYSHVAVAGEAWGWEKGAAAGTAAAAARRRRAKPTGGAFTPPRSAPVTAPLDGRPTGAASEAGAQAGSPAGHRGRVQPPQSLRTVAVPNSGWREVVRTPS